MNRPLILGISLILVILVIILPLIIIDLMTQKEDAGVAEVRTIIGGATDYWLPLANLGGLTEDNESIEMGLTSNTLAKQIDIGTKVCVEKHTKPWGEVVYWIKSIYDEKIGCVY